MTDHPVRAPAGLAFHHVGVMGPALVLARFLLAAEFLTYGVRKFLHPENIYRLIEAHHLPGELVYLVIPWQVGFGLAIVLGLQTRLAAMALFGFCVIAPSIFWLDNLENLTRDYATAGGFLFLIVFGPGPISLDSKFGRNGRDLVSNRFARIWDNRLLMERLIFFGRVLIATPFLADVVKKIIYTDQGQAFLQIGGIPRSFLYGLIIVEGVGALTLLVGYRTELAAAIRLVAGACVHSAQSSSVPRAVHRKFLGSRVQPFPEERRPIEQFLQGPRCHRRTDYAHRPWARAVLMGCGIKADEFD